MQNTCLLIELIRKKSLLPGPSVMFNKRNISLNTPAVICHHLNVPSAWCWSFCSSRKVCRSHKWIPGISFSANHRLCEGVITYPFSYLWTIINNIYVVLKTKDLERMTYFKRFPSIFRALINCYQTKFYVEKLENDLFSANQSLIFITFCKFLFK